MGRGLPSCCSPIPRPGLATATLSTGCGRRNVRIRVQPARLEVQVNRAPLPFARALAPKRNLGLVDLVERRVLDGDDLDVPMRDHREGGALEVGEARSRTARKLLGPR